jgi:hypothetical protein
VVAILNSGNQPASGNVGRIRDVFGMVENVGVSVGVVSASSFRSIVISTSGFGGHHFEFRRRPTSGNVGSVISKSGLVENVGVEVEIASLSQVVQKQLTLPFFQPPSWI